MSGTEAATVSRPWDPVEHTLGQLSKHSIPIEQICRALEPHFTAEDVIAFLADEKVPPSPGKYFLFSKATTLSMTICSRIQDIADARLREKLQMEGRQEWYVVPRHFGVAGREGSVLTCSRREFLELVKLSQPELVAGLAEEAIAELPRLD